MFASGPILAFHQTSDSFYPGINNLKPGYFFALLDLLRSFGFSFREGEAGRPVTVTFDDAYADNYAVLARLCEMAITPVVFVPTVCIGRTNDWDYASRLFPARHLEGDMIRELAGRGVVFGSHGHSHRDLTGLPDEDVAAELARSRDILGDITGREINLLSYPFARFSPGVNRIAVESGYRLGFALDGPNDRNAPPDSFVRYRVPIYGCDDYFSLRGKLLGDSDLERLKNRIINRLAGGTIITRRRIN